MKINSIKERILHSRGKTIDTKQCVIDDTTHFSILEAYKSTRTNMMFTMAEVEGCKKIIVTSSGSGEGKTTSTINLAITFAQIGAKVLVIDADLRRPRIHAYLDLEGKTGLTQYLGGLEKDMSKVIQSVSRYNFDCVVGGHIPPNPSELLISSRMTELLNSLSDSYDYIFVDSPPLNVVTDCVSIAKQMSGAIVVVRQNYTTSEMLKQAISALEFGKIKIFGYLLNNSKVNQDRKYVHAKYGKY